MQTFTLSVGVENSPKEGPELVHYPLVFGDPQIELLSHESEGVDDTDATSAALERALPEWAWLSWHSESPINLCAVLSIARPHSLDELIAWLAQERA